MCSSSLTVSPSFYICYLYIQSHDSTPIREKFCGILNNHAIYNFEVRHPRFVEPKLLNGKSTVKTQLYLLAMSGFKLHVQRPKHVVVNCYVIHPLIANKYSCVLTVLLQFSNHAIYVVLLTFISYFTIYTTVFMPYVLFCIYFWDPKHLHCHLIRVYLR